MENVEANEYNSQRTRMNIIKNGCAGGIPTRSKLSVFWEYHSMEVIVRRAVVVVWPSTPGAWLLVLIAIPHNAI